MSEKMTDIEFAEKVESEGALYAFTEYGLTENDLHDDSPLRDLVAEVAHVGKQLMTLIETLETDLFEVMEGQDDD